MSVGTNIRAWRKRNKVYQWKLAHDADVHVMTLSRIENGKTENPDLRTLQRLANAMGVKLEEVLGDD